MLFRSDRLPENLTEYFGLFASERQNVLKGVEYVRNSPLIGPRVPVHGLMVDIQSGRLEWLVDGYRALETVGVPSPSLSTQPLDALRQLLPFDLGEMKFPEGKIGELASKAEGVIGKMEHFADKAEHLAGEAGEFAEKVGHLASKATDWLREVQIHGDEPPAPPKPPPLRVQAPVQKPVPKQGRPVPIPPRLRPWPPERRPGK